MIAILGATGYVGGSLGRHLADQGRAVTLFAREPQKLAGRGRPLAARVRDLADFNAADFDLVVNAIGAGDPSRVKAVGADIVTVTASWDRRVLETMSSRTRYVFLSSGAVYGSFDQPLGATSPIGQPRNSADSIPAYTTAKLEAETRHRSAISRPILDLRIFGYADPSIDLKGTFLLAELARAIRDRTVFFTSPEDVVRDYAGVQELWALIGAWEHAGAPNRPLDLYSTAPAAKHDILKQCAARYGLRVEHAGKAPSTPTGAKRFYFPQGRAAADLGFKPERDTIAVLTDTIDAIVATGPEAG